MTDKTDELRDIFTSVADDDTVTETQAESRGSLARDAEGVDDRLAAVIDRIDERFGLRSDADRETLATVVRRYFEGDDDATIADAIDADSETVRTARLDCHLVRDDDVPAAVDLDALRDELAESDPTDVEAGPDDATLADALEASAADVARARRVLATRTRARSVSHRFRAEFEDVLADAGLSTTMTESVREDGLTEATEDIDSLESDADVGF